MAYKECNELTRFWNIVNRLERAEIMGAKVSITSAEIADMLFIGRQLARYDRIESERTRR